MCGGYGTPTRDNDDADILTDSHALFSATIRPGNKNESTKWTSAHEEAQKLYGKLDRHENGGCA